MPNPALTEILASYVPKLIQQRVIADPAPIESPVAEDMQAAILFADISGFTHLTERLAEKGPTGVESLARILNEYFGQLIDIIHDYGGDVVKFAGDAVIAVWNIVPDTTGTTELERTQGKPASVSRADQWQWTMRAAECALKIRERLSNYQAEDANLYLKLAISSGVITTAHVGGVFNRWEFLLTGNPLVEVGIANSLAKAGDIIIAPSAWRLIRNDTIGEAVEFELKDAIAQGGRLTELNKPSSIFASNQKIDIPDSAENSLRAYIPGAIINRLSAGQSSWIAELRRVTILFVNLPGINQDTELAEAQNLARIIQSSVYRYEGSINKINVDDKGITFLAALGLPPFSHEDDPARGVQAALMIRKELGARKIQSYIGITTGKIFCGSIGNDTRREYTIIGNAVNLSARLMGVASHQDEIIAKYGIAIIADRATYDSAKDAVGFEDLPPQQVKGRTEPVEIFQPIDLKKSIIRPTTELIGRQEEKTMIANALQELSRGVPHHTIVLQGEAGIGKSRLFEDLVRQAETLQVNMYNGGGDPIEKTTSYHAWRTIFYKIFKIDSVDEDHAVMEKRVVDILNAIDSDLIRYIALLNVILPMQIPDNELTSAMTGEIRGGNTREMLTRILSYAASQAPLLIVMEDLHWFDSASWTLLVDVQQKVRPILLALNTRPLSDPQPVQFKQLLDTPDTRLVKLEAMLLDDVEALVCQRLGVKSIPPMIGRFAEELAYALRESGVLVIENNECKIHSRMMTLEDLTLPDTLQAAITNRIDGLAPSQQLTLKVASVIGRIFSFRVLEAVHPIEADRQALPDYMETLTRLSLTLIESEMPDLAYIFKHAVTQEVAYNLMLYSQRRQLHQAVAEWIEHSSQGNVESYYPLLAHHWTQAAEAHDAAQNKRAIMENYSNKEAIQFFSAALEWEQKLPNPENQDGIRKRQFRQASWHGRMGLAHYGLGSLPDCEAHLREALRLLGKPLPKNEIQFVLGLFPQLARQVLHWNFPSRFVGAYRNEHERVLAIEISRLYELMARIYFYSNQTIPIVYTGLSLMNSAEKAGPSPELASAYSSMSVLAGIAQLHKLAEAYVSRAVTISKEFNQPSNLITVDVVTSAYKITVGEWDEVRERVEEAKSICEQLGDYRQWGDCAAMLGESALISGDVQYAVNIQNKLLEDARRRRSPLHQCWGLLGVARNNMRLGKEAEAIPMLEEALEILKETPNLASSIETNGQLAVAHLHMGEDEKALAYASQVLEMTSGLSPTVYSMNIGFAAVSDVCFELWEKALQDPHRKPESDQYKLLAEKALKAVLAFEKVFPIGKPVTPYYQGWYEWLLGKHDMAFKSWNKGLEAALKFNMPYEEALAHYRLGAGLPANDPVRLEHFIRARMIFEKMGAMHELKTLQAIA